MAAVVRSLDQRVVPGVLAADRHIDVHPALASLLPQGLVRGSSVTCQGAAAVSTAFLLTAAATRAGAWVGIAGLPTFGAQACHEMGTPLERVVVVGDPADAAGSDRTWALVLGALVDGFDLVVFGATHQVRFGTARRVQARLQQRGGLLVLVGGPGAFSADVRVDTTATWDGLGAGNGYLRQRVVDVTVDGRRVPRARHDRLLLPGPSGVIESVGHRHLVAQPEPVEHLDRLQRTG